MRRNLGALILEDIVCMNMDKLKERMGDEEFDAGRALYRRGAVRENQRSADFLTYSVAGAHGFIKIYPNGRMECPCEKSHFCRHTLAALIDANESGALRAMQEMRAKARAATLFSVMEGALPECVMARLEPEIRMNGLDMRIGLRIGQDRLYVIRSITEFLASLKSSEPLSFGKGFTFFPA